MSFGLMKQASSDARDRLGLEDLVRLREKCAIRKLVLEKWEMTDPEVLAMVTDSLEDYDRRIITKRAEIKKQAEREMAKQANLLGYSIPL
jgi:hypothetical protein